MFQNKALKILSFTILISLSLLITKCVYDPPPKGIDIYFENQTNKFVYVSDTSLNDLQNNVSVCETSFVNKQRFISAIPNWIPPYRVWKNFISEHEILSLKNNSDKIKFFVAEDSNYILKENRISILKENKIFEIDVKEIKRFEINHIFITEDTIYLSHNFNR